MTSFEQELVSSLKDKPPLLNLKMGPKFVAKTGVLTKGLLSADAKVLTHDCCSFAGPQTLCAQQRNRLLGTELACERFQNASKIGDLCPLTSMFFVGAKLQQSCVNTFVLHAARSRNVSLAALGPTVLFLSSVMFLLKISL